MGAVRKELKRNFHGQHGGKKRDLKKNHESQSEHRGCLHPGQTTRPGGKEKGTISLKGKTWERKEAEDECQAAVVHHGLPQDVS